VTFLYDTGIRLVLLLQTLSGLEGPMRFFTFLGTADFFILVLPVVYWCIDSSLGIRIGFILLFSNGFNELVKLALQGPRPYWISPQVKALAAESSFGVPSGHAQIAAGVWGTVAAHLHRSWAWVLAVVIIFLIGISRIFLAVHFPHDVILGWLLGGLTLWAFLSLWNPIAAWLKHRTFLQQALLAVAVALAFVLADGLLVYASRGYVVPTEWMSNAVRAGEPYPDPLSQEGVLTSSGTLLGLAIGLAWISGRGGFKPSGPTWKRLLCFLIGLLGLLILYLGLSYVLPSDSSLTGSTFRFVRYAIIGAWVSAGAPLAFFRLELTDAPGTAVGAKP
jgi:membrane-associated phospholipid phosphatase